MARCSYAAFFFLFYLSSSVECTSVFLDSRGPPAPLSLDACFDDKAEKAVSCVPDFVNAAFGVRVEADGKCPAGDEDDGGECKEREEGRSRTAHFLTDLHNPNNETCWQTEFASENVSLTVSMKKKYELTYISLHFCSGQKPDHLAIYKSMDHGRTWQPFQFYSSDCLGTFNRQKSVSITRANEQEALCVDTHLGKDAGELEQNFTGSCGLIHFLLFMQGLASHFPPWLTGQAPRTSSTAPSCKTGSPPPTSGSPSRPGRWPSPRWRTIS